MPYPRKVRGKEEEIFSMLRLGIALKGIAAKFGVNETSIRKITGKTGRPSGYPPRPISERFWKKVVRSEKCWEWIGSTGKPGYGHIILKGKYVDAHRISYMLFRGEIPKGLMVLHTCDNKKCVNPDHLFLGTQKDNMAQWARKRLELRKVGEPTVSIRAIR